jgi:hypothetical protein
MSLYSWIFGDEETVEIPVIHTIEEMVKSHGEKKIALEEAETAVAKMKADLETLRIAINNRLESEKNRIANNDISESSIIVESTTKKTAQPMFH